MHFSGFFGLSEDDQAISHLNRMEVMTAVMTGHDCDCSQSVDFLESTCSHSHDCWSEDRSQVIVKGRKRA